MSPSAKSSYNFIINSSLVFNGSLEELKQSNLSASQFVKTLSGSKTKDDDNKEEILLENFDFEDLVYRFKCRMEDNI